MTTPAADNSIGAISSDDSGVSSDTYSIEQICEMYSINDEEKKWWEENATDTDPVLILEPKEALGQIDLRNGVQMGFDDNVQLVSDTVTKYCKKRLSLLVFYFEDLGKLLKSKERIQTDVPNAFYPSDVTRNAYGLEEDLRTRPETIITHMFFSLDDKKGKMEFVPDTGFFKL